MIGGLPLGNKWGWRKREYARGTISGLQTSTQNETSFICDDKDSLSQMKIKKFPSKINFICDDRQTNKQKIA